MMVVATHMPRATAPFTPDDDSAQLTIAIVGLLASRRAVQRLSELAVNDELLVVASGSGAPAMVAGLRRQLPRHDVVSLDIAVSSGVLGQHTLAVNEFLEIGSLPVVVVPARAVAEVAAQLSDFLRADRVMRMSGRADLREVWRRAERRLVDVTDRT
jgi:MFS transporter, NNP family, nitrate/nitrite transporter